MDQQLFNQFRAIIKRESGIHLTDEKKQLLANRIQKRLRALQLDTPSKYLEIIELDASQEELAQLIDVVSTNVTYFYREEKHFPIFSNILSTLAAQGQNSLKVWCAAASSGEEPYTLAITAAHALDLKRVSLKILATDICTPVLQHAIAGIYQEQQLEKLPDNLRKNSFVKVETGNGPAWKVAPHITQLTVFKRLNLSQFPFPLQGSIDVIFCRNVMIYFDHELRQKIINEFSRLLSPGGYLFLSLSENLLRIEHPLENCGVGVYRKPLAGRTK